MNATDYSMDESTIAKWLIRSRIADGPVAEGLYQADKCSEHATLKDAPRTEPTARYRQIAELAVLAACDETVEIGDEYFAVSQIMAYHHIDLSTLPMKERVNLVRDFTLGLNAILRVRRERPGGLEYWRRLAEADREHMKALSQARAERERAKLSIVRGEER